MKKLAYVILLVNIISNGYVNAEVDLDDYSIIFNRQSKQIKELKQKIKTLEENIDQINIKLDNYLSPDAIRPDRQIISSNANMQNKDKIVTLDDKTAYDLALANFKDGKLLTAEREFGDFIKNYPDSRYQSNAYFWQAETFYQRGEFAKAAEIYQKGYKQNPGGSKAADTLLKQAFALAAIDKKQEACKLLNTLDIEFPQRPSLSIKKAKDAKNNFKCK